MDSEVKQDSTSRAKQLAGEQFELLKSLGEGGEAEVFLANDMRLQRNVALKICRETELNKLSEQFNEARTLAQINHTNVVQIFDVIERDGALVLVMEYVQGDDLLRWQASHLLNLEQKIHLLLQVIQGLSAIHQVGIIHSDLKPSNILISEQGEVKIVDFGIARVGSEKADEVSCIASPDYASPEQLALKSLSFASDIYSFAVLALELLIGERPKGIKDGVFVENETLTQLGVPQSLIFLFEEMLEPQDEKRLADASTVVSRIQSTHRILVQQKILDQVTSKVMAKPEQPSTKRKQLGWSAALVVVALIALWSLVTVQQPQQQEYIAILPLETRDLGQLPESQRAWVLAAVDDSLRQVVLQSPHLQLIARSEVSQYKQLATLAKATGATEILETQLDCTSAQCNITLNQLTGERWTVNRQAQWLAPLDSAYSLGLSVQQQAQSLFGEPQNDSDNQFTELQYKRYLTLYQQVALSGEADIDVLREIEALLDTAPLFFPAYRLYRSTAITLYRATEQQQLLEQLERVLLKAPLAYQQTRYFVVDMFALATAQQKQDKLIKYLKLAKDVGVKPSTLLELEGSYLFSMNDFDGASEIFEQASRVRPSVKNLFNWSLVLWYQGDRQSAKLRLKELLELDPMDYSANQLLASIYLMDGELEQAIERYKVLIGDNRQSTEYGNLSLAYLLNAQYDEALESAEQAVENAPQNASALLNLADIHQLAGNGETARGIYQRIEGLIKQQSDFDSLLLKAQVEAHLGFAIEASKTINQINKLQPDSAEAAFTSALVYSVIGEHISATAKVEDALALDMGGVWFSLPWFKPLCRYFAEDKQQIAAHLRCEKIN